MHRYEPKISLITLLLDTSRDSSCYMPQANLLGCVAMVFVQTTVHHIEANSSGSFRCSSFMREKLPFAHSHIKPSSVALRGFQVNVLLLRTCPESFAQGEGLPNASLIYPATILKDFFLICTPPSISVLMLTCSCLFKPSSKHELAHSPEKSSIDNLNFTY